ncbi:MAG: hypothetical protein AB1716_18260 [Planctomycetota bacterium]
MTDPYPNLPPVDDLGDVELSPAGRARRDAILRTTLVAARRARRTRRFAAGAGSLAAVLAIALLIHAWPRNVQPVAPNGNGTGAVPAVPDGPAPVVRLEFVQVIPTDPTISARLAAPELPATWRTVDDETLLAVLADAGLRGGLVSINGQTQLVPGELFHNLEPLSEQ